HQAGADDAFVNALQHGFGADFGEGFAGESRGLKTRRYYGQYGQRWSFAEKFTGSTGTPDGSVGGTFEYSTLGGVCLGGVEETPAGQRRHGLRSTARVRPLYFDASSARGVLRPTGGAGGLRRRKGGSG